MPAQVIKLSDMLASPRKYQRQFQFLFIKLAASPRKITMRNEIIKLNNNQQIELNRKIHRRYKKNSLDFLAEQERIPKFDIYANEDNEIYQRADHEFSQVEFVMSINNTSKISIKSKKRLLRPIYGASRAVRDIAMTQLLYPFKTKFTSIIDGANVGNIVSTPLPAGKLLANILKELKSYDIEKRLQIALSLLDEVETLQAMGVRHLHLSPHNMFYDDKKRRITILNYHHAQNNDHDLSEIPSLPTYLAPEVINKESHIKSDNYSVGIILAQLFGVPLQKIQCIAINNKENFVAQISAEMKEKISAPHLGKIIKATQELLNTIPDERKTIAEAKNELLIVANSSKKDANYHVHDTKAKQSFFKSVNTPNLMLDNAAFIEPLYKKISTVLIELPWQKTSRFGGVPNSIQFMRDVLGAYGKNTTPLDKLNMLQIFCEKNAEMPTWMRIVRGRHDITHELIKILAQIKTSSIPHLVDDIETLQEQFKTTFKISNSKLPMTDKLITDVKHPVAARSHHIAAH
jgi:serine/threonine protein kinase